MKTKFKVGYRVEIKHRRREGCVGKIVNIPSEDQVAVEFKNWENGHRCSGFATRGSGWYYGVEDLEITNRPLTDFSEL